MFLKLSGQDPGIHPRSRGRRRWPGGHKTIIQSLMDSLHRLSDAEATQLTDPEEKILRLMLEGYDETEISQPLQSQPE